MSENATAEANQSIESELADLLNDLSEVQNDLLSVLSEKRQVMVANDLDGMKQIEERETLLGARLEACHTRRAELLQTAKSQGLPDTGLGRLAQSFPDPAAQRLGASAAAASARMRLLQHHCLTNWVLAQRSLLHISQIIEIIASGGRVKPTYSPSQSPNQSNSSACGGLMDHEA